jgi:hypothetical protein
MEEKKRKAGRPSLYGEPTKKKTFVLPISKEKQVEAMVKAFCKSCEVKR